MQTTHTDLRTPAKPTYPAKSTRKWRDTEDALQVHVHVATGGANYLLVWGACWCRRRASLGCSGRSDSRRPTGGWHQTVSCGAHSVDGGMGGHLCGRLVCIHANSRESGMA